MSERLRDFTLRERRRLILERGADLRFPPVAGCLDQGEACWRDALMDASPRELDAIERTLDEAHAEQSRVADQFQHGWFDLMIERAEERAIAFRDLPWPSADPLPSQRQCVLDCVTDANRAGLRVPAFDLFWVAADAARQFTGRAERGTDGKYRVTLNVNLLPRELRRVALHEMQHLSDLRSGLFERLETGQTEKRAMAFAAWALPWRTV